MALTRPIVSMSVGSWLALDRQDDRPLLVEPGGNQLVLAGTDGPADIADVDLVSRCDRR